MIELEDTVEVPGVGLVDVTDCRQVLHAVRVILRVPEGGSIFKQALELRELVDSLEVKS